LALASNVVFIIYAYQAGLAPVLILHGLLVPINGVRLLQLWESSGRAPPPGPRAVRRRGPLAVSPTTYAFGSRSGLAPVSQGRHCRTRRG
jgi:hypothetical protein